MKLRQTLYAVLILGGCVRADTTSYTDTAAYHGQSYSRVLVIADGLPLDQIQAAEVAAAQAIGPGAMVGMQVLPPSIRGDESATAARLAELKPDAALIIYGVQESYETSPMPYTYTPGTTYGTASVVGNSVYYNAYTTPAYVSGGGIIQKPRATFGAYMLDGATGKQIWQANINTRGSAFHDHVSLAASAGEEAVSQARADGLLK